MKQVLPDIEFSVGDKVIYKPAEVGLPAMVKKVQINPVTDEVEYRLAAKRDSRVTVRAVTTGRSIVESKYFVEYDPNLDH